MKVLKFTDGSEFRIHDVFDQSYEFLDMHIEDSLYGNPALIDFRCHCNTPIFSLMSKYKGYLKSKTGIKWEFECFCYSLSYDNMLMSVRLMCTKPEFTRNIVTTTYTSIDNAIQSTWKLSRLDSVKSDIIKLDDDHKFYQISESNHSLCTRLCNAYKHDTVFGYLLNGLKFVDLKAWKMEVELQDQADIKLQSPANWTSGKLYDSTLDFIDYNHSSPRFETDSNHIMVSNFDKIQWVDNVYKELIGNYLYNRRLQLIKQSNSFKINYIPDFEVGTYVKIKSPQIKFEKCYVSKRIFNMSQTAVEVSIFIQSIEPAT